MAKKILCLGDSLTKGLAGYSYIKFLDSKYEIINKGVDGDTTKGGYRRLKRYLKASMNEDILVYIIAIGINDLIIPYLSTISSLWGFENKWEIKKCLKDDDEFENVYRKYLELLTKYHKKVILLGMPLIQLDNFPMEAVKKRNEIIKVLSKEYGFNYIDVLEMQLNYCANKYNIFSWDKRNAKVLFDYLLMITNSKIKDKLSYKRFLEFTVDGIHYNKLSANMIAKEVNRVLNKL